MYLKLTWLCLILAAISEGLPTVYKYNENKILELDLIPVSSTVIPLPVYQLSYGISVGSAIKDEKIKKPEGPITLLTVHNNKKAVPQIKSKPNDVSVVKEVSKKEFNN